MASAVWLSKAEDDAGTAPSTAVQDELQAVRAALASDRTIAYHPNVGQGADDTLLLLDLPIRGWVELRYTVLYTLEEWCAKCKTQQPSTHDTDNIWGPRVNKDDPKVKSMTDAERDAYRYAAHVVRRRGVDEPKDDVRADWLRGGQCDVQDFSGWTMRDPSAGILSTQLCTAKVVEVPPADAHEKGLNYFGYAPQLCNGKHLPHNVFPLLELKCSERAKWHDHVFVLAVYSKAYTRDEYNALCESDSDKVPPRMRDERYDTALHHATYKKMVKNGTLPSRQMKSRRIRASQLKLPVTWLLDVPLCESIPLAMRRVVKWGHVGPLYDNANLTVELTDESYKPRWLLAHRITSNYITQKPQCTVEALSWSGVVPDGSAFRTLVWDDDLPRMIVRSECEDLLSAIINAKASINVRFFGKLRMRVAIARDHLQLCSPEEAEQKLVAKYPDEEKRKPWTALQRVMRDEFSYEVFIKKYVQQLHQTDAAYGAAKRTQERTVERTMSEFEQHPAAAKRSRRE